MVRLTYSDHLILEISWPRLSCRSCSHAATTKIKSSLHCIFFQWRHGIACKRDCRTIDCRLRANGHRMLEHSCTCAHTDTSMAQRNCIPRPHYDCAHVCNSRNSTLCMAWRAWGGREDQSVMNHPKSKASWRNTYSCTKSCVTPHANTPATHTKNWTKGLPCISILSTDSLLPGLSLSPAAAS